MSQNPIDDAGGIEPTGSSNQPPKSTPDGNRFQQEMQQPSAPAQGAGTPEGISPMEIGQQPQISENPTVQSLLTQTQDAQTSLQSIQSDLNNNTNVRFRKSQEYLMKNKLADAQEHIQSAGNKLGANMPEQAAASPGQNPVQKFVGMVADSQQQMAAAQQQLQELQKSGKPLKAADMMLIQVKLSQAQQELSFASILMGKVVESFKTFMNIQI